MLNSNALCAGICDGANLAHFMNDSALSKRKESIMKWYAGFLIAGLCAGAVPALHGQNDTDPAAVVARVSGENLTMADLQSKEGGKLLQAEYQYYLNERKALEELIDNRLLADEARKRNISLDQLLNTEVYKGVKDPTEDQLEVYYEGLDTQEPYEAVRVDVLQHLRELRRTKARAAFVENLRKQANINVLLMPPAVNLNIAKAYTKGSQEAPVVFVEFADYECPYCQKVNPQIQQLKKDYGDKLAVVYKDFPLPMHHSSEKAAEAARCAGAQGKFWEYHDVLFYSKQVDVDALKEHARVLKLNGDAFDTCLDSGSQATAVKQDHFFSGVIDYGTLKDMVNQQLNLAAATHAKEQISQK
jgi:protein-disulfide isomerase